MKKLFRTTCAMLGTFVIITSVHADTSKNTSISPPSLSKTWIQIGDSSYAGVQAEKLILARIREIEETRKTPEDKQKFLEQFSIKLLKIAGIYEKKDWGIAPNYWIKWIGWMSWEYSDIAKIFRAVEIDIKNEIANPGTTFTITQYLDKVDSFVGSCWWNMSREDFINAMENFNIDSNIRALLLDFFDGQATTDSRKKVYEKWRTEGKTAFLFTSSYESDINKKFGRWSDSVLQKAIEWGVTNVFGTGKINIGYYYRAYSLAWNYKGKIAREEFERLMKKWELEPEVQKIALDMFDGKLNIYHWKEIVNRKWEVISNGPATSVIGNKWANVDNDLNAMLAMAKTNNERFYINISYDTARSTPGTWWKSEAVAVDYMIHGYWSKNSDMIRLSKNKKNPKDYLAKVDAIIKQAVDDSIAWKIGIQYLGEAFKKLPKDFTE